MNPKLQLVHIVELVHVRHSNINVIHDWHAPAMGVYPAIHDVQVKLLVQLLQLLINDEHNSQFPVELKAYVETQVVQENLSKQS